jgi:hypothetical protein
MKVKYVKFLQILVAGCIATTVLCNQVEAKSSWKGQSHRQATKSQGAKRDSLTDNEFFTQLSPSNRVLYKSLGSDGRKLARQLINDTEETLVGSPSAGASCHSFGSCNGGNQSADFNSSSAQGGCPATQMSIGSSMEESYLTPNEAVQLAAKEMARKREETASKKEEKGFWSRFFGW